MKSSALTFQPFCHAQGLIARGIVHRKTWKPTLNAVSLFHWNYLMLCAARDGMGLRVSLETTVAAVSHIPFGEIPAVIWSSWTQSKYDNNSIRWQNKQRARTRQKIKCQFLSCARIVQSTFFLMAVTCGVVYITQLNIADSVCLSQRRRKRCLKLHVNNGNSCTKSFYFSQRTHQWALRLFSSLSLYTPNALGWSYYAGVMRSLIISRFELKQRNTHCPWFPLSLT